MQRLRSSGISVLGSLALPNVRRKALNSWSAVQDTYLSTKDIFERHKVVFTISTSLASVGTAWIGYSMRYMHQTKVEDRLNSIESAMKESQHIQRDEIKKIVSSETVSLPACIATAGTSLIFGYAFGWRGGKWYANRKFRKEQMKLLGQIKPRRWQFRQFLRRSSARSKTPDSMRTLKETTKETTTSLPAKSTALVNS